MSTIATGSSCKRGDACGRRRCRRRRARRRSGSTPVVALKSSIATDRAGEPRPESTAGGSAAGADTVAPRAARASCSDSVGRALTPASPRRSRPRASAAPPSAERVAQLGERRARRRGMRRVVEEARRPRRPCRSPVASSWMSSGTTARPGDQVRHADERHRDQAAGERVGERRGRGTRSPSGVPARPSPRLRCRTPR